MSLHIRNVSVDPDLSSYALRNHCILCNALFHRTLGGYQSLSACGAEGKYPSLASNPTPVFKSSSLIWSQLTEVTRPQQYTSQGKQDVKVNWICLPQGGIQ